MPRRIVIAGASARAVADSAHRLGIEVYAADLFGDRDLLAVAQGWYPAVPYPEALPDLVDRFPPAPWLYTGALENHPEIIAAISQRRPLAGSSPQSLSLVRDPDRLARMVEDAGLLVPETRCSPDGLATDGSWLLKPQASAGGHGIRRWFGWQEGDQTSNRWVWQRFIPGQPWSAAFLIRSDSHRLIGVSRQLIGCSWCHAKPFSWSGGVDLAPETLSPSRRALLDRLGDVLGAACGLTGLIGVDFVVDRCGRGHIIEVNPRPTASMELIERSTGLSLVAAQLTACGDNSPSAKPIHSRQEIWSKAVLFTPRSLRFDDHAAEVVVSLRNPWTTADGWPAVADVPMPAQTIAAGRPVCTIFARGQSAPDSLRTLIRRTTALSAAVC
jgi:uncharacterized protein